MKTFLDWKYDKVLKIMIADHLFIIIFVCSFFLQDIIYDVLKGKLGNWKSYYKRLLQTFSLVGHD